MTRRNFLKLLGLGAVAIATPSLIRDKLTMDGSKLKLISEGLTNHGKQYTVKHDEENDVYITSYTGSGSSGHTIPLGFQPTTVFIRRTS